MGGDEYAKLGVETSTGTKLVSVSGHVQRPGNYEIELGIPSREIIYGLAGGPPEGRKVKCWFPGGSSSPVLTGEDLDIPYDFDSLAKAGTMLGSGAIIVVDDSTADPRRGAEGREVLPPRVLRQVHPLPRGHQLDGEDARADRARRGDADGPGDHGERAGAHHRQLPVRPRRRDGDADRFDDQEVQARSSKRTSRRCAWAPVARAAAGDVGGGRGSRIRRDAAGVRRCSPRPTTIACTIYAHPDRGLADAAARTEHDHLHDRRPGGPGARKLDAGRRRQARRRRDPRVLLRAQTRQPCRRVPHVPRRNRGHPQAADRLLHPGQGRHGRAHPDPSA